MGTGVKVFKNCQLGRTHNDINCRATASCLSTVVQIVTHVACVITFSTCVALAVYFAPVEVTSVARIFVGGKHPADVTQPCISRVQV